MGPLDSYGPGVAYRPHPYSWDLPLNFVSLLLENLHYNLSFSYTFYKSIQILLLYFVHLIVMKNHVQLQ